MQKDVKRTRSRGPTQYEADFQGRQRIEKIV
jgi:hypothetical protein